MASCTYDPQRPHTIENFDPAEADPRAGLTCLGPGPPFPLPWQYGDWDPNAVSLQQLCAKPQYGGSGPFRHIGGFCPVFAPVLPPPLGPGRAEDVLAFDNTPGAAPSNLLPNPRVALYCRTRCFCNHFVTDRSVQPIEVPRLYEDEFFAPARDSYEIRIDLYDDYLVNPMIHRGQGNNVRRVTPIWRMREITQRTDAGGFSFVSIAPDNEITCEGSIPDWPLPAPFVANDFATLQHLCAVQLSGGNAKANAGGYCYQSFGYPKIWFADEMTPRLDWTTAESIAAIAVRYHCWRFCRCVNGAVDRESALQRRWALTNNVVVVQRDDGAIDLIIGPRGPVGLATLKILPAPTGNVPASGTCGPDGRQFCDQPWPSELLGPVPTAPPAPPAPSPQHHRLAASGIPSPPTCGAQCTQNRDCHREQTAEPCRCVALSEGQARALGSDPVFPGAACLLWGQAMLEYFSTAKARTRLGGRSVEESGDEEPWGCPCNASYVSRSCCERRDGFVWEDVRWKLGRLESG